MFNGIRVDRYLPPTPGISLSRPVWVPVGLDIQFLARGYTLRYY